MKNIVLLALKKEKKPVSFDRIIFRIEKMKSEALGEDVFLSDGEKKEVLDTLNELVSQYEVYKSDDKYISFSKTSFRFGRFYGNRDGAGRVSVDSSYVDKEGQFIIQNEKYDISKYNANGAIDGDYVLIDTGDCNGNKVIDIVERCLDYIQGEVYSVGGSYFVRPIDKKKQSLTIALLGEAIEGERVLVSLDEQTASNFYIGSIVKTYNHKDDPNEDILWEAYRLGIDNEFSNESLEQLENIPDSIRDIDRIGREDFTHMECFTIDGYDTKDMDDAVGLYINEKGNYVLITSIIDISSLIPYDSPLDRDAFKKGNSYYPGGTVISEYPHKISKGIGSINPGVDRLSISDIIEISPAGEVVSYRFVPTVIRSRLKMSYGKVNQILKDGIVEAEYLPYEKTLQLMRGLAFILHENRIKRGSCEYKRPEPCGVYSSNGHMTGVSVRTPDVAENLIEEFMLIANEERGKFFAKNDIPCIYRVHDDPNVDKLQELLNLLEALHLPFGDASARELVANRKAFQRLIAHVSNCGRLSNMLTTELIKTMSRAKYSPINTGHSGLAASYYAQGTSSARRYGDSTIQRIAWDCVFKPDLNGKMKKIWRKRVPDIAERITYTERVAEELERQVFRMQCAEYMSQFEGEEFEATVVGISNECLLVQLDNMIEGTVRVRDLKGDYIYSQDSYSLVSLDDECNYYMGDRLLLKLKSSSKETRKIDFEVVQKLIETEVRNSDEINGAVKIKTINERAKRRKKEK